MLDKVLIVDNPHLEKSEGLRDAERSCMKHAFNSELRVMKERCIHAENATGLRPSE